MKHRILRINISLFVTLFDLIAGIDVQAYDRIEVAGNVFVIALPIAEAGLTLGVKDGQGTLEFGHRLQKARGCRFQSVTPYSFANCYPYSIRRDRRETLTPHSRSAFDRRSVL